MPHWHHLQQEITFCGDFGSACVVCSGATGIVSLRLNIQKKIIGRLLKNIWFGGSLTPPKGCIFIRFACY